MDRIGEIDTETAKHAPAKARAEYLVFLLGVVGGLTWRLVLAWQDLPILVARLNADDFYYYLVIARNIASGNGPTFDGLSLTNGFHPLYALLLAPLFMVASDPVTVIHIALSFLALLDVGTALLIFLIIRKLASTTAAAFASSLWLFNPFVIAIELHGVETSLYLFLVALAVFLYVGIREQLTETCLAGVLGFGLVLGLVILARTDGIFLLAAIGLDMLVLVIRDSRGQGSLTRFLGVCFPMSVALLTVTGPWWAWNLVNFNSIVQVSGRATFLAFHGYDWLEPATIIGGAANALRRYYARLAAFLSQLIVFCVLAVLMRKGQVELLPQTASRLGFVGVYAGALSLFYGLYFWHIQDWYVTPALFAGTLYAGCYHDWIVGSESSAWKWTRTFYRPSVRHLYAPITGMLIFLILWNTRGFGNVRQSGGLELADWIRSNLPENARIGSWNSGIIGYFGQRTVMNLDGVVNNEFFAHITARRIESTDPEAIAFLKLREMEYLTDYENVIPPDHPLVTSGLLEAIWSSNSGNLIVYRLR